MEQKRRRHRVWREEGGRCGGLDVNFAQEGSLPPTALVSYPGSGNTWTRHLLQAATGIFTGSIYQDQQLYMKGFFGELEPWNAGTTFTQKTHDGSPAHIQAFNGTGVLLLRNPYRAIISYHNFLFGGHTGYAPISNYRRKDWGAFVQLQARSWLEVAITWITQARVLQVLHYEHLKEDPAQHLLNVLDFFGFPCDLLRLQCLQSLENWSFKRAEVFIPETLEIFSETVRDKVDRAVRYVDYLLKQHHQPPLPLHLYEFYNNTPSHQLIKVACLAGETAAACDERVYRLNLAKKWKRRKKTINKKNETSIPEISASNVKEQHGVRRTEKPDSLERFTKSKVGWFMTKMFNSIMRYTRADPITRMLRDSHTQHVQHPPVLPPSLANLSSNPTIR
ncbi:sialate:O-sulfotransferase 1-like isoform X2 [Procambarus clarkii]